MSALDHGKNLVIRLQINNPSQFPLIIKRSEIVLGISQERLQCCLADDFPLSPQISKLVEITMRITEEEYARYLRDGLVIGVHGILRGVGKSQLRAWGEQGRRPAKLDRKRFARLKQLLAAGKTQAECAAELGVSVRTIGRAVSRK